MPPMHGAKLHFHLVTIYSYTHFKHASLQDWTVASHSALLILCNNEGPGEITKGFWTHPITSISRCQPDVRSGVRPTTSYLSNEPPIELYEVPEER
jgi:hypothetical protein